MLLKPLRVFRTAFACLSDASKSVQVFEKNDVHLTRLQRVVVDENQEALLRAEILRRADNVCLYGNKMHPQKLKQ